jgi:hypothetical protein
MRLQFSNRVEGSEEGDSGRIVGNPEVGFGRNAAGVEAIKGEWRLIDCSRQVGSTRVELEPWAQQMFTSCSTRCAGPKSAPHFAFQSGTV